NYLVRREDQNAELREYIAHVSFLTTYYEPADKLRKAADDIEAQLNHEGQVEREVDVAQAGEVTGATAVATRPVTGAAGKRRRRSAATNEEAWRDESEQLVEVGRRRRRNKAGHYILEFRLRVARSERILRSTNHDDGGTDDNDARWASLTEYNELFDASRVVEDSDGGEGV
ncbi:hypothetical protein PHMEG_00039807, partial [Phytophthora megakarya]